jgi:hypothetical protein
MIDKDVWQAVYDTLNEDDRETLGPPPTVDELLAYERGELTDADRDRVRRLLVAYPELARAFATPLPDEGDYLDDEVVARQWKSFQKQQRSNVVYIWQTATAIAATLTIVFGALYWHARTELSTPHVDGVAQILTPGATRGTASQNAIVDVRRDDSECLIAVVISESEYPAYRLELTDGAGTKIWSREPVVRPLQNVFYVMLPASTLKPGDYTLSVDGLRGSAREHVDTYAFQVRRQQ